jgi:hypothetical protein
MAPVTERTGLRAGSRISIATRVFLGGLLSLAAGCSSLPQAGGGSQAGLAAPLLPILGGDAGTGGNLFVSDFYSSEILIYPAGQQNPSPSGSISNGVSYPYNLAVDKAGTLYVQNNDNTVTEYPKGATAPSTTLHEPPYGYGTGITVTVGRDLTVYTADHLAGKVFEFKSGYTSPTTTLSVEEAFGLALDSKNNLYVGWAPASSGGPGHVMKFKPGATTGKDLGISVKYEGGLAVDDNDDLLVGDQGNEVIDIFKRGAKTPFRTIDTAPVYPYQFALDKANQYLYLVSGTPAAVYVYDYATGALAWTDSQGMKSSGYAEGVALRPVAKP